jgi:hypothetical protein
MPQAPAFDDIVLETVDFARSDGPVAKIELLDSRWRVTINSSMEQLLAANGPCG